MSHEPIKGASSDDKPEEFILEELEIFAPPPIEEKVVTESSQSNGWSSLAYFTQIGFTIAVSVLLGVLIGRFLDRRLGTDPWLLLLFSLLGVLVALYYIYRISKRFSK